jgi:hypothetical protein
LSVKLNAQFWKFLILLKITGKLADNLKGSINALFRLADFRHPRNRKSPLQLNTYARRFCWGQNDHAAFTLQYAQKTAQVSLNEVLMIFKHKSPPKA